jgi:rhodanese-related sulfurtransferase
MMAQFVEFFSNHLGLSAMWVISLGAIVFYHQRTGSQGVGSQQLVMLINRKGAVVVDVRDKKEFEVGHIVDSINIPLSKLKQRLTELKKHQEKPVVVVCKLGQHSGEAAKTLQEAGHTEVYKLTGGLTEWKAQSLPLIQK